MRTAVVAALLLLLAVPAATAQMSPQLDLQVQAPVDPVGPEGAAVTVTLRMHCPNQAYLMPSQIVDLEVRGMPGSVIDGPESVTFDSFPCVQQTSQEATAQFTIKLPTDVPGAQPFEYRVEAAPRDDGNPVFRPSEARDASFTLSSPPSDEPAEEEGALADNETVSDALSTAAEEASKGDGVAEVPGPSAALALLGVALAALRRRA